MSKGTILNEFEQVEYDKVSKQYKLVGVPMDETAVKMYCKAVVRVVNPSLLMSISKERKSFLANNLNEETYFESLFDKRK